MCSFVLEQLDEVLVIVVRWKGNLFALVNLYDFCLLHEWKDAVCLEIILQERVSHVIWRVE